MRLYDLFSLCKIPLSLSLGLTTLLGYLAQSGTPSLRGGLISLLVVFILACGCAALNNLQDTTYDRKLQRTRLRPLPQGRLSPNKVLLAALLLLAAGLTGLYLLDNTRASFYGGIGAIILYNLLYTPLKRLTSLALIPGTLCGMLPPLLGCLLAQGHPFSPPNITLMTLVGLWQFPHFCLILLTRQEEYRSAGYPTALKTFSEEQLKRIILSWVMAFALVSLFLPLFGIVPMPLAALVPLNALTVVACFLPFGIRPVPATHRNSRRLFLLLNGSLFVNISLGIAANI